MSYGKTLQDYIPMLRRAGYAPTGARVVNQWARYYPLDKRGIVVFLSVDGGFKVSNENGQQIGHGCEPWELEALL